MELIDKEKLLNANYCDHCPHKMTESCDRYCHERMNNILATRIMIKDAPAVDAVEVVRCKDCKHWFSNVAGYTGEEIGHCELANWMVGKNGYCVYGERKEVQDGSD